MATAIKEVAMSTDGSAAFGGPCLWSWVRDAIWCLC